MLGEHLESIPPGEACHREVIRYPGALYKKYNTKEEAIAAFHGGNHMEVEDLDSEQKPFAPHLKTNNSVVRCLVVVIVFEALLIAYLAAKLM